MLAEATETSVSGRPDLEAVINRVLRQVGTGVRALVDDVEVRLQGVVSNDNERLRAEDLVTTVLRATGAGRIVASSIQSLEAVIGRRLQGLVDRLDVRVDGSTVAVFGVLDRYQQLAQVRNRIIEELTELNVERGIDTSAIVALEQKVVDALGPAGVAGSVHVTDTDLVVRVLDGPIAAARLVAETVIRALGVGRIVRVEDSPITTTAPAGTEPPPARSPQTPSRVVDLQLPVVPSFGGPDDPDLHPASPPATAPPGVVSAPAEAPRPAPESPDAEPGQRPQPVPAAGPPAQPPVAAPSSRAADAPPGDPAAFPSADAAPDAADGDSIEFDVIGHSPRPAQSRGTQPESPAGPNEASPAPAGPREPRLSDPWIPEEARSVQSEEELAAFAMELARDLSPQARVRRARPRTSVLELAADPWAAAPRTPVATAPERRAPTGLIAAGVGIAAVVIAGGWFLSRDTGGDDGRDEIAAPSETPGATPATGEVGAPPLDAQGSDESAAAPDRAPATTAVSTPEPSSTPSTALSPDDEQAAGGSEQPDQPRAPPPVDSGDAGPDGDPDGDTDGDTDGDVTGPDASEGAGDGEPDPASGSAADLAALTLALDEAGLAELEIADVDEAAGVVAFGGAVASMADVETASSAARAAGFAEANTDGIAITDVTADVSDALRAAGFSDLEVTATSVAVQVSGEVAGVEDEQAVTATVEAVLAANMLDLVLALDVEALPFTGPANPLLAALAVFLIVGGIVLVRIAGRATAPGEPRRAEHARSACTGMRRSSGARTACAEQTVQVPASLRPGLRPANALHPPHHRRGPFQDGGRSSPVWAHRPIGALRPHKCSPRSACCSRPTRVSHPIRA
jgi:hypothetical protein